jgi:hypothetical protein
VWLAVFLVTAPLTPLFAQSRATSADLTGLVKDESSAVVPGARITATNLETNVERVVVTDVAGRFDIQAVPPGSYRVRVELSGFSTHVLEHVDLALGSAAALDVVLHVASVTEQVTVAAAPEVFDGPRSVIATVISQQQIATLPINGRNFISFSLLTPGVISDRMPLQGASATSGLSFAGQRARANNITVDGLDNNDETVGAVRATFSQEAVREFQVVTQSASAEFGKASGGTVNIVTRSGTNTPGGTLFGYFRDDALNAKEHFEQFDPSGQPIDRPKAPYSQKQFGGVFGGPIRKDRTFYFTSLERLDATANNFVTIDDKTPVSVFGQPVGTAADILRRNGFPIDTGHVPYDVTSSQFVVKLDHNIRPTDMLTLRYNYADGSNENTETWGGLVARSRGAALSNTDHMLAASQTDVLTSHVVNELRFQAASRTQSLLGLDPTCAGPCDREDEGGPTIEISGVANVGRNRLTPQLRNNVRYQMLDTVSYQAGEHLWKAGVDFNVVHHTKASLPLHFGGRYIFAPLPAIPGLLPAPVSAIQAVALGLPAAYVQGYGNSNAPYVTSDVSAFIQDQWRVSPELTLQAGVRYQTQFWEDRTYNVPGYGQYRIPPDRNNVAPRIGITWNPSGKQNMSLHGAYGVYYDNIISGVVAVADVINGGADAVRTLVLQFPRSVAAWNAPGRRLAESAVGAFPSLIISVDPNLKTSYTQQFSFGVDRELPGQTILAASYLNARGFNQIGTIDYNPLVPSLGPGRRPEDVGGVAGTSASILQYTSYGETWYQGLSVSARKRVGTRYQFLVSYVLSKAEDNSSDFQSAFVPQNSGMGRDKNNRSGLPVGFDPMQERGPSLQDQRHRFVFSGSCEIRGGVQLAGIATVGSGVPFNILAGTDLNGDGDAGNFPTDRARRIPADPTSALPRNPGRLPAEATVDVRLSRTFRLGKVRAEPMLEVFNLFNRVNYTDINNVFGVGPYPDAPLPTYGQFQRAAPPRQAQVAVRLVF